MGTSNKKKTQQQQPAKITYLAKRKLKDRRILENKYGRVVYFATGTGNFNQGTCTFIKATEQKHTHTHSWVARAKAKEKERKCRKKK